MTGTILLLSMTSGLCPRWLGEQGTGWGLISVNAVPSRRVEPCPQGRCGISALESEFESLCDSECLPPFFLRDHQNLDKSLRDPRPTGDQRCPELKFFVGDFEVSSHC